MATWEKLVIASGSSAQYIKGDGTVANFPSFVSAETNLFLGDGGSLLTAPGTNRLIYTGQISSNVSGMFPATDNSNSIITLNRHSGNWNSQLGFSSNGNIYYRKFSNNAINTSQAWLKVWHEGNFGQPLQLTGGTISGSLNIFASGGDANLRLRSGATRSGLFIDKPATTTVMGSALVLADSTFRLGTASYYHMEMTQAGNTILKGGGNTALTIDTSQNATFAGRIAISSAFTASELLGVKGSVGSDWGARIENTSSTGAGALIKSATTNAGVQLFQVRSGSDNVFTIMGDQNATFAGNVTVNGSTTTPMTISAGTDKVFTFSSAIGETSNVPTIQTINTAGSALVGFGVRASDIKLATESVTIKAPNNANAILHLNADNADNNQDHWRIESTTDGFLRIATRDSGSYETKFEIGASTGNVRITNELKVQSGLAVNNASLGSHKFVVDNGTSSFNRGNSAGNILDVRGQNASQMKVTTTAFTVTPSSTFASSVTSNGSIIRRANALTNNGIAMLTTDSNHGAMRLYNSTGTLKTQLSSGTNSYILESSLGIGTSSPSAPMEIYSTNDEHLRINNPDGGWNYINFNHGSTTEGFIGTNGNEEVILGSTPNNPIVFMVQNAERARITNTGIGIGTSDPSNRKLKVLQTSGDGSVEISTNDTSNAFLKFGTDSDGSERGGFVGIDYSDQVLRLNYGSGFDGTNNGLAIGASSATFAGTISLGGTTTTKILDSGSYLVLDAPNGVILRDSGANKLILNANVFRPNNDSAVTLGTDTHRFLDIYTDGLDIRAEVYSTLNLKSVHAYGQNRDWKITTNNFGSGSWGGISIDQSTVTGGSTYVQKFGIDLNGRVGINTSSPSQGQSTPISDVKLDVLGNQMLSNLSTTNTDQSKLFFFRSDGAVASQGAVPSGLKMGAIEWDALTSGDNNNSIASARIETVASNTWSSASVRNAHIAFSTIGANTLNERMRLTSTGLAIGTIPTHNLNVYNGSGGSSMTVGKYASGKTVGVLATSADTSGYFQIQSYASQGSTFGVLALNRSGGNVNIGTAGDYAKLTIGGSGDVLALRSSSGAGAMTIFEGGTTRFRMTSLNGSNGVAFKVPSATALTLASDLSATFSGTLKLANTTTAPTNGESLPPALEFIGRGWDSNSGSDLIMGKIHLGGDYGEYGSGATQAWLGFSVQGSGGLGSEPETLIEGLRVLADGGVVANSEVRIQKDDGRFIIQRTSTTHQAEMWMSGTQAYFGSTNGTTVNIKTNNQNAIIINTAQQITFAKNITVGTGQILTPSGINLALNPNTGTVSIGGVINATGTGTNQFAGNVELDHSKLIKFTGDSTTPTIGGDGSHLQFNSYSGIDNSVAVDSAQFTYHSNQAGTTTIIYGGGGLLTKGDVNIEPAGGAAGLWLKSTNSHANIRLINNNGATNTIDEWKIQSNTNHDLKFYNANSEKVTFSSDGDATFAGDLDASAGQSLTGWHTQDKIWVMPSDFMPSTGRNEYNIAMVDNGGEAKTMHGAVSGYVNIPIPSGYKVTHYRLNGTASVEIKAYYSDCTTATATSVMPAPRYTNSEYATNPSSGIEANDTTGRYMILRWNCTSTSHRLYGGYVKIAKI